MTIERPAGEEPRGTVTEGLEIRSLEIPDVKVFRAPKKSDSRGWVMPSYSMNGLRAAGIDFVPLHENHCYSPKRGTMRGFHYQLPPYDQGKLIRVTRGRMLDVNVDLRRSSPTFGRYVMAELDPDGWNQILVPPGFAHCYCTLTDDCETIFKLDREFAPGHARGLAWNDPDLDIPWPIPADEVIVLPRDLDRPRFSTVTEFYD
ncbi:dTDP-4-dehydrorhamnose 3,5-epimerase family protein [Marinibaculum pumilum]|uniref:dTDP-4-dehydrorhamnose 3,5-epimerase n=1 Tax=Marinibaculum pumilum TaxID=1766165 RepID=A0ABV7KX32_9PROT